MTLVRPDVVSNQVCLCGIDPGSLNLGFCVLYYQEDTLEINHIEATSIDVEKLRYDYPYVDSGYSDRTLRIYGLKNKLRDLFLYYDPKAIVCESAFYNPGRPNAFGVLIECITAVRFSALGYDPSVPFITYTPSDIKKTIGAHATKGGKEAILKTLTANQEIIKAVDHHSLQHLNDHAVDAIAIAYTELLIMRKSLCLK